MLRDYRSAKVSENQQQDIHFPAAHPDAYHG